MSGLFIALGLTNCGRPATVEINMERLRIIG